MVTAKPEIGPFIPYFGAKWRSAREYPEPRFARVVEVFSGGAGYSLAHRGRNVRLADTSPHIAAAWQFLLRAAEDPWMVANLAAPVTSVNDVPPEARALVGFWLNPGSAMPKVTPSRRADPTSAVYFAGSVWSPKTRDRIAAQVQSVRHWTFRQADWRSTVADLLDGNEPATVFIDPPYQVAGSHYGGPRWSRDDYLDLGLACQKLAGAGHQVIACEREGADWLPFCKLSSYHGSLRDGVEVIWTGEDEA